MAPKYLHTVTITGADDAVNPRDLFEISKTFPFVEWGFLRSSEREGSPRYPSGKWIDSVAHTFMSHAVPRRKFSAHLCGNLSRQLMSGNVATVDNESGLFNRFQLNGWGNYILPGFRAAKLFPEVEFIAQVPGKASFAATCALITRGDYSNLSMLYDPSGGRGIASEVYPQPFPGVNIGYAGGITAENVESTLIGLALFETPHWIDLESGVRTDDRFDLDKVRAVLELCRPYVQEKP